MGHLGDDARRAPCAPCASLVPALHRPAGYPLHWRRLRARCAADRSAGCGTLPHEATPCGRTEHDARLAARHRGGLFLLRVDPHPLDGRHADEPKRPERHLHPAQLLGPRTIRQHAIVLRPDVRLRGGSQQRRHGCIEGRPQDLEPRDQEKLHGEGSLLRLLRHPGL